jgi:molecular chaperone HscB
MLNPFHILSLEPRFDLDKVTIEQVYFRLQRLYHPDRMTGKSAEARVQAVQASMDINESYRLLRSPLLRARALLALQGIRVGGENDSVRPGQELLMEAIESREDLEGAKSISALETLASKAASAYQETVARLEEAFAASDYQRAAQLTLRLGYVEKLQADIATRINT